MTDKRVENLNILSYSRLITPEELKRRLPISERAAASVITSRGVIKNILDRKDRRLFIVVGPCSIHDPVAAIEYGRRLRALAEQVKDALYLVMRVYFEKPRSTIGWKGLINDPHLNDSFEIEEGLHIARRLLLELAEMDLPLATEALDPISPQYLQDLISWSAIGARTAESQTHREMSSGLSCAVGFKNGTDGGLAVAVNALKSVSHPHNFLGIDPDGRVSIVSTAGNRYGHVVLRGGNGKPNYDAVHVAMCERALQQAGLSSEHHGGLQPRELLQGPGAATAGGAERDQPDHRGQPLDHRPDDRKQLELGQAAHPGRPRQTEIRRFRYRCLHRLGYHGKDHPGHQIWNQAFRKPADQQSLIKRRRGQVLHCNIIPSFHARSPAQLDSPSR